MKRQEIINVIENLAHYKNFNNPEGLPIAHLDYKCERYINLKSTRSHKDNPHWITRFHQFLGSPLIAIGITNTPEYGMVPIFIFEPGPKKNPINPDYLHIQDFIGLDPSRIDAILLQIAMNLQNEIIEDIMNYANIKVLEIHGMLLPQSIGNNALHLNFDFNKPDTPITSGYQKTWKSYALAESLILAQYEAIEYYMQYLTR